MPDSSFTVEGTEDDPAALITVYREAEDGYAPTGTLVGHKFSTLTKVNKRKHKDDEDEDHYRHIKRITETDDEVIVVFGKSEEYEDEDMPIDTNYKKDKEKYREARPAQDIEIRAEDDGSISVSGCAAVFNPETVIGGQWWEQISQGAFRDRIGRDDVVFLINHSGLPLARTRSGTLQLAEDDHGLRVDAFLDASDPDVRSIVPKMRRGNLNKISFAFVPKQQSWDDEAEMPVRTIQEVELYDLSIVTTPSYSGTEISLRSLEHHRKQNRKSQAQQLDEVYLLPATDSSFRC